MKKLIFIAASITIGSFFTAPSIAQETRGNEKKASEIKGKISSIAGGCAISFNHEVKSPRDVATGQSSGKRQHKPFHFIVDIKDNSVSEAKNKIVTAAATSSDKVSVSDISVVINSGEKSRKLPVDEGEFTVPALEDGDHSLVLSWSWGESNMGSQKRCDAGFVLTISDGVCMAINEQGVQTKKK